MSLVLAPASARASGICPHFGPIQRTGAGIDENGPSTAANEVGVEVGADSRLAGFLDHRLGVGGTCVGKHLRSEYRGTVGEDK